MATCPQCKGHLTEHHRCPRRPVLAWAETLLWAVAGGFAGLLLVAMFDPHGQITDLDSISVIAGALLAVGINRVVRH